MAFAVPAEGGDGSQFHGDVPGAPDDRAQVAHRRAVAHQVDVFASRGQGRGEVAGAGDDAVAQKRELPAVLHTDDGAVPHLLQGGVQVDGGLVQFKVFPQVGAVGQAHALLRHQVVLHLHDDRLPAGQRQLVGNLAAGQAAADDRDPLAHRLPVEVIAGFDHLFVPGHLFQHAGHRAGGQDDLLPAERLQRGDLGVVTDLDAPLLDLEPVPGQQLPQLALVGLGAGRDKGAAQMVRFFVDDRRMAAVLEDHGGLHPADAAADDGDGLGGLGRLDVVLVRLHRPGVDRAAGQVQRVVQLLVVGDALVVAHVEAAVVAQDAGAYLLLAALQQLGHPLRVGQEGAGKACAVQPSGRDGAGGGLGVQAARRHDRDINELADVLHVGQVAVLRHIDGRVGPVPGVVGAVVAVQHIVAGVLEVFGGAFGLRHVPPDLGVLLAGQGPFAEVLSFGDDAVPQRDREVRPTGGLDGLDDLHGEAVAVLKAAAVLVGAHVDVFQRELIQQIALVDGMDLYAVHARFLEQQRALGKGVHELADLPHGHLAGGDLVAPAVGRGAGRGRDLVQVQHWLGEHPQEGVGVQRLHQGADAEGTAKASGELDEQLSPGLVELGQPGFQLIVHLLVLVEPLAEHGVIHRLAARQHKPDVVLRDRLDELRAGFVKVVLFQPAEQVGPAHRGEDDAVLDLDRADLPRGKERAVFLLH